MHFRPRCVCSCIHPFAYGNAAVRTFGRAHRHRPYGFVWVDCVWVLAPTVSFGWIVRDCHRNILRVDGLCVAHSSATAPLWTRYFLKYP